MKSDLKTYMLLAKGRVCVLTGKIDGWTQTTVSLLEGDSPRDLPGRLLFVGRAKDWEPALFHVDMLIGLHLKDLGFLEMLREAWILTHHKTEKAHYIEFYRKPLRAR